MVALYKNMTESEVQKKTEQILIKLKSLGSADKVNLGD